MKSLRFWEIGLCCLGAVVALIPILPRTGAFWGISESSEFGLTPGVVVNAIEVGSPAESAGLEVGDRVLAIDDRPLAFGTLRKELSSIKPGEQRKLTIKRDENETTLTAQGRTPEIEAILYRNWQLAFGLPLVALAMLLFVTQPLPVRLWRPMIILIVGLALAVVAITGPTWNWAFTGVRQYWMIDNFPKAAWQEIGCIVVAVALVLLGLLQLRRTLSNRLTS